MDSRSSLVIKRDLDRLKRYPLWGIEVELYQPDNMFVWSVKIRGLRHTIWEAGIFRVFIQFSPEYNYMPPSVWFHTIPFHPNIDMSSGKPCMTILDTWWSEHMTMHSVLLTLQEMLSNPIVEEAINEDAAQALLNAPEIYEKMSHECIQASIRVNAGLPPFDPNHELHLMKQAFPTPHVRVDYPQSTRGATKTQGDSEKRTQLVSFESYQDFWKNIGTSQNDKTKVAELGQLQETDASAMFTEEEMKEHLQKQLEQHTYIMYGKFGKDGKKKEKKKKHDKMEKVEMMKKVYLKQRTLNTPMSTARENTVDDREAADLLQWASNLEEKHLDDF